MKKNIIILFAIISTGLMSCQLTKRIFSKKKPVRYYYSDKAYYDYNTDCTKSDSLILMNDTTFQFTIKQECNYISSITGTYLRKYSLSNPETVHFELTKEERSKIESLYFDEKLDTLPDNFKPHCKLTTWQTISEKHTIYYKGKKKHFYYNCYYDCTDKEQRIILDKIFRYREYVSKIILEKESVRRLKPSNLIEI